MIRYCSALLLAVFCFGLLPACNTATPENYFDIAVLNVNMMMGFAGAEVPREISEPSATMENGKAVQLTHKAMVDSKLQFLEDNFKKLRQLKETADTKEMLQASLALNELVLPVYRNEYQQLARLFDDGAAKDAIQSFNQDIHDKYAARYAALFDRLTVAGKAYASKHNIKVNWGK